VRRLAAFAGTVLVASSVGAVGVMVLADQSLDADPVPSQRSSGPDGDVRPVVELDALRLLERAAAAPATTAYSGTQYVTAWTVAAGRRATSRVVEVRHEPARGTTWWPGGAGVPAGAQVHEAGSPTPSLLGAGAVSLIARHYSLSTAVPDRVAGRDADVVEAHRPSSTGARQVVARFWLDQATGLVLRREVYDERGRPTRASAFIDVAVHSPHVAAPGESPDVAAPGDTAWPDSLDSAQVRRMRQHGWACPRALPGPLPLVDARRGGDEGSVLHLSYADGIASVSVFQQRGSLDEGRLSGYRRTAIGGRTVWARNEVPARAVWSAGGLVYTLVADAPQRTVDDAVAALYAEPEGGVDGQMDRLGRGLDRVASWFNPMD